MTLFQEKFSKPQSKMRSVELRLGCFVYVKDLVPSLGGERGLC